MFCCIIIKRNFNYDKKISLSHSINSLNIVIFDVMKHGIVSRGGSVTSGMTSTEKIIIGIVILILIIVFIIFVIYLISRSGKKKKTSVEWREEHTLIGDADL